MGNKSKADKLDIEAGAGGTQGGRRPTGVPPAEPSVTGPLAPQGRWSAGRKREVVLRLLHGESMDAVSREVGVEIYRLEAWREEALAGMDAGLTSRRGDPVQTELEKGPFLNVGLKPGSGWHRREWPPLTANFNIPSPSETASSQRQYQTFRTRRNGSVANDPPRRESMGQACRASTRSLQAQRNSGWPISLTSISWYALFTWR